MNFPAGARLMISVDASPRVRAVVVSDDGLVLGLKLPIGTRFPGWPGTADAIVIQRVRLMHNERVAYYDLATGRRVDITLTHPEVT